MAMQIEKGGIISYLPTLNNTFLNNIMEKLEQSIFQIKLKKVWTRQIIKDLQKGNSVVLMTKGKGRVKSKFFWKLSFYYYNSCTNNKKI